MIHILERGVSIANEDEDCGVKFELCIPFMDLDVTICAAWAFRRRRSATLSLAESFSVY